VVADIDRTIAAEMIMQQWLELASPAVTNFRA